MGTVLKQPPPSRSPGGEAQLPTSLASPELSRVASSAMGTLKDRAVLQAIFNPNTPFGEEELDLGEEAEEDVDEGKCLTLASSPPHWLVCRPPWGGTGRSYKVPFCPMTLG